MGLFVRTTGLARARVKIGLANIAYNMRRLVWLNRPKCTRLKPGIMRRQRETARKNRSNGVRSTSPQPVRLHASQKSGYLEVPSFLREDSSHRLGLVGLDFELFIETAIAERNGPPTQRPLRLEAAILSRAFFSSDWSGTTKRQGGGGDISLSMVTRRGAPVPSAP